MIQVKDVRFSVQLEQIEPKSIKITKDQYETIDLIKPYIEFFETPYDPAQIDYSPLYRIISREDNDKIKLFIEKSQKGSKIEVTMPTDSKKFIVFDFFEFLRYRLPKISATSLHPGKMQLEVLKYDLIPKSCPKQLRRSNYLKFTMHFTDQENSTSALTDIIRNMPKYNKFELKDTTFTNYSTPSTQNVFVNINRNAYPCLLLKAGKKCNVQIGDFQFLEEKTLTSQRIITVDFIDTSKKIIKSVKQLQEPFLIRAPPVKQVLTTSYQPEEVGIALMQKNYKNALMMLTVTSFECFTSHVFELSLQDAFVEIVTAVQSNFKNFGMAGDILQQLKLKKVFNSIDDIDKFKNKFVFLSILQKLFKDKLSIYTTAAINNLQTQIIQDAINQRPNLELKIDDFIFNELNQLEIINSENISKYSFQDVVYPILGNNLSKLLQKVEFSKNPILMSIQQILKKNKIFLNNLQENPALPDAVFRRIYCSLGKVKVFGLNYKELIRNDIIQYEWQKLKKFEFIGEGDKQLVSVKLVLESQIDITPEELIFMISGYKMYQSPTDGFKKKE